MNNILFDQAPHQIAVGYVSGDTCHTCLICKQTYEQGQIYQYKDAMYDAEKRMQLHIQDEHQGMLAYLLACNPDLFGISAMQMEMLQLFSQQFTDKEIALQQGIAQSTIRNYRYKLREKEKQAKMFLALMQLVEGANQRPINQLDQTALVDPPVSATTLDMRFNITAAEKEKYIKQYFDENGALLEYPAKAKRKVILLQVIATHFKPETVYSEIEINRILQRIFADYVTIRRALIEYGFLDRSDDGSKYWVNQ